MSKNSVGLDKAKSQKTIEKLNELLANFSVFYMNLRGFHWNIKGEGFFVLHEKFEEIYDELADQIDEIAERVLMLDEFPTHAYSDYLKVSTIKEVKDVTKARPAIEHLVEGLQTLIAFEREIIEIAGDADDEGTVALMSDYIGSQEKTLWMYNSWLGK